MPPSPRRPLAGARAAAPCMECKRHTAPNRSQFARARQEMSQKLQRIVGQTISVSSSCVSVCLRAFVSNPFSQPDSFPLPRSRLSPLFHIIERRTKSDQGFNGGRGRMKSNWSVALGAIALLSVGVVPRGYQQTPPPTQPPATAAPHHNRRHRAAVVDVAAASKRTLPLALTSPRGLRSRGSTRRLSRSSSCSRPATRSNPFSPIRSSKIRSASRSTATAGCTCSRCARTCATPRDRTRAPRSAGSRGTRTPTVTATTTSTRCSSTTWSCHGSPFRSATASSSPSKPTTATCTSTRTPTVTVCPTRRSCSIRESGASRTWSGSPAA